MHSSRDQLVSKCPSIEPHLYYLAITSPLLPTSLPLSFLSFPFPFPSPFLPPPPPLPLLNTRGGSYQSLSGTRGPSKGSSAPAAGPSHPSTTPCWRTWSSQQRSLGRGFVSVLTAAGSSRCIWTRRSRPTLSTRWAAHKASMMEGQRTRPEGGAANQARGWGSAPGQRVGQRTRPEGGAAHQARGWGSAPGQRVGQQTRPEGGAANQARGWGSAQARGWGSAPGQANCFGRSLDFTSLCKLATPWMFSSHLAVAVSKSWK